MTEEKFEPAGSSRRVTALLTVVFLGWAGGVSLLVVIGAFVVMLVLHELGHLLVARWSGMQVTEYFIGFGPRIWSMRRGETEYGVKAIPAGAYVRITGMSSMEEVAPVDEHRSFRAQSFPRRVAVAFAGSGMQFLLAIALLTVLFTTIGRPDSSSWEVGVVVEGSTAQSLGVVSGDQVEKVAGVSVEDFEKFGEVVRASTGHLVPFEINHEGTSFVRTARLNERLTVIGAAAFAGLQEGDQLVSVDHAPVRYWSDLPASLEGQGPVRVEALRYGQDTVVLMVAINKLPTEAMAVSGFFGVSPQRPLVTENIVSATGQAVSEVAELVAASAKALVKFFTPGGIADFVRGTVSSDGGEAADGVALTSEDENRLLSIYGAARLGSAAFESGIYQFIWFMVLINVFIAVFNLVPLLPFDGGHIAIAIYERLRSFGGRDYRADASKLLPLTWVVLMFLLSLSALALFRDIVDLPDFG